MARRIVDTSMLQQLVEHSQSQDVQRGSPRTLDPRFPVFSTPVNQDLLVYIPRTNVVATENGETMQMLHSFIHQGKIGKQFVFLRCISGLAGNPVFEQLGYDGVCPACEAMTEVWELFNLKLQAEARRMGIDPQDDPHNALKPIRDKLLQEMDLGAAEEYVTFPIVVIPTKARGIPADDWQQNLQPMFVHWRKKRYDSAITDSLQQLMTNPGHPAGRFWIWKYTYDTGGRQPNARDAARNAKYMIIQDPQMLEALKSIIPFAEEKAKGFTLLKAAEVVVANQFMYKDDMIVELNKIMARTRRLLDMARASGGAMVSLPGQVQPQLPPGIPAGAVGAVGPVGVPGGNPLMGFRIPGNESQGAPMNLGQEQTPAPNPVPNGAPNAFPGMVNQNQNQAPNPAPAPNPASAPNQAPNQHGMNFNFPPNMGGPVQM